MSDPRPVQPQLHRSPDAVALAESVADVLVARLRGGTRGMGEFHVVLTGGTVAARVHRATQGRLGVADVTRDVSWPRVHVWWGDERYVPLGHEERNDREAMADLLSHVPVPAAQLHPFPGAPAPGDDAARAAGDSLSGAASVMADEVSRQAPAEFDLVMLGTGPDGHVASVFPGHGDLLVSGDVVGVRHSPKDPPLRLSLTLERLARTRELWVFASGEAKAEALAAAWDGAELPLAEVTRAALERGARVHWFLDDEAASLIEE